MVWRFFVGAFMVIGILVAAGAVNDVVAQDESRRLITVYDRGVKKVFLTKAQSLGEALSEQSIALDVRDTVEPRVTEALTAPEYNVNIYRARPVVVVDGALRIKTVSPFQTAKQIARDVGITVYDEDKTQLQPMTDFVSDGAGLQLTITRATAFTLDLYGKKTTVRTQGKTIGEMLALKNIALTAADRVSVPLETAITPGIEVRVWREGIQTIAIDQEIPVSSRIVYSADQPYGYRAVLTAGTTGIRSITYQIDVQGGVERSRTEIANIVTRPATEQTEVIGIRNDGGGLSLSRGAQVFTDSKGVAHRETYYDLNMGVVMRSCGQGGKYSVRPDGAKVDAQGYVLIAANYAIYPKCSIVETSIGLGKVYDTGGFVARHPYGFDLATDWTRADGI